MTMKRLLLLSAATILLAFPSCLKDDGPDYTEWKETNENFYEGALNLKIEDGSKEYEALSPVWGPSYQVLMKWHTPRSVNAITPMDNSTVDVVYSLKTIDGTMIDNSYRSQYGDSIFRTKPSATVPGFHTALTSMAEGDSVTAIVPYNSGYGIKGSAKIKPYSTLIFNIKLKRIVAWEVPN